MPLKLKNPADKILCDTLNIFILLQQKPKGDSKCNIQRSRLTHTRQVQYIYLYTIHTRAKNKYHNVINVL